MKKEKLLYLSIFVTGLLVNLSITTYSQQTLEIDNDTLHLKLDLTRGGAINYISKSGTSRNIVNIHDEGRYIQQSYYAGKTLDRIAEGQNPAWSPWSWNPIQVGDSYNNRAEILDYRKDGDTLYVKCIPMLWDMNNEPAEAEMEQWTILDGNVIKVRNRLTCFRTDDIYGEGIIRDQELPAVYPISSLKNLYSYFGEFPFTGGPLDNPKVINLSSGFWGRYENNMVTENWMAFVDDNLWGIGVYTPVCDNFLAGMAGSPGFEATDGSTSYIAPVKREALYKNSVYEYEYYLVVGSLFKIRSEIYAIKGIQVNEWEFQEDNEGWDQKTVNGVPSYSEGAFHFNINDVESHVTKELNSWETQSLNYLWLKLKNETSGDSSEIRFYSGMDSAMVFFSIIPNNTSYQDVFIDLDTMAFWKNSSLIDSIRWYPAIGEATGSVSLDFIRFIKDKIKITTETGVNELRGLGENLQLYAAELPSLSAADVQWSVNLPGIATIDQSGLLSAVSEGVVTVSAEMKDGSGVSGSVKIMIVDTGQKNRWEFIESIEGWDKNLNNGIVNHEDGALKFTVLDNDPYVNNNVAPWIVGDLKYLWMRIKNETAGNSGAVYFFPETGPFGFVTFPLQPDDSQYRDIFIDMTQLEIWTRDVKMSSIRLDPNNDGSLGDIYVDFIRFYADLIRISSEGNETEITSIGNTLQLFAEVLVPGIGQEVQWSVDNSGIASIDENGLLTAESEGQVIITATSNENQDVLGTFAVEVVLAHTSLDQFGIQEQEIYPNPTGNSLFFKNPGDVEDITIMDITGKTIRNIPGGQISGSLNISFLPAGYYLIKIQKMDEKISFTGFIKE